MADSNLAPVHDQPDRPPEPGMALCLSGGGYRAMIFHVGVLWRLNEAGLLGSLKRVSSVSGGSITAGGGGVFLPETACSPGGAGAGGAGGGVGAPAEVGAAAHPRGLDTCG